MNYDPAKVKRLINLARAVTLLARQKRRPRTYTQALPGLVLARVGELRAELDGLPDGLDLEAIGKELEMSILALLKA